MAELKIAGRKIDPGHNVYCVAELSSNFLGSYERAVALIRAAKEAGADAVKVQAYSADSMCHQDSGATWHGADLYSLYAANAMPMAWHGPLMRYAAGLGLAYIASVFDPATVDALDFIGVDALKIASFELVDTPLIRHAASKGRLLILSTGMATKAEILAAIAAADEGLRALGPGSSLRPPGPADLALLKCTSAYPAPVEEANLATLTRMAREWPKAVLGLSDHTCSNDVAQTAVRLGACLIERHFTLSRDEGGPDAAWSDEPHEFAAMVRAVRAIDEIRPIDETRPGAGVGEPNFGPTASEAESVGLRRSLWVVKEVRAGKPFTADNVRSLRPAGGLPPGELGEVLGRHARHNIAAGTPLRKEMVEG